jgi:branched-chain amino acid transport system substrate-binding protein
MEQSWRSAPFFGVLICLALFASGCAPARPVAPDGTAIAQATVGPAHYRRGGQQGNGASSGPIVRVGAALSLSGPAMQVGMAQRNGLKLAQDEINTSHMLGNKRLEVVVDDDGSDRDQASTVFQRFIENSHVLAIMGPTLSDTALSVDPMAQQAGVPVLAISNAATGITEIGNFIFRESLSESQLVPRIIAALRGRLALNSAALLYSDNDPNRAGFHGFKSALQSLGIRITDEQTFNPDQTDFSPQLEDIAASRPDVLFVVAPSSAAASILVQARGHGLDKLPIVGNNAFNSDAVLRNAGDAAEGLIVGSAWSANTASPRNQQFMQSYRARYGVNPDQIAAQAYTGVYILATAIHDANTSTDPRAVRDALEQITGLDTPLGSFSFNDEHEADYPCIVQVVRQGRFVKFGI